MPQRSEQKPESEKLTPPRERAEGTQPAGDELSSAELPRRGFLRYSLYTAFQAVTLSALATHLGKRAWIDSNTADAQADWEHIKNLQSAERHVYAPAYLSGMHEKLKLAGIPRREIISDAETTNVLKPLVQLILKDAERDRKSFGPAQMESSLLRIGAISTLSGIPVAQFVPELKLRGLVRECIADRWNDTLRHQNQLDLSPIVYRLESMHDLCHILGYEPGRFGVSTPEIKDAFLPALDREWREVEALQTPTESDAIRVWAMHRMARLCKFNLSDRYGADSIASVESRFPGPPELRTPPPPESYLDGLKHFPFYR